MANYVISYDLHHRRKYDNLYKLLAAWRAVKLTESQWLVSLVVDAKQARDFVARTLDNDDTVTVLELPRGADWATVNAPAAANAWLANNVTPSQKAA